MPSFFVSTDGLLWDATPVSNAFLTEFMPYAPEGYVKVYLYACMLAHGNREEGTSLPMDVANALDMSLEEVEGALRYWERCRLVERVGDNPPLYRFESAAKVVNENRLMPEDPAYGAFSQSLYQLFEGKSRRLHGADISTAYEWVEQLHLPPEVVTMLIAHMIDTHGVHFSFKAAGKYAARMREEAVMTMADAELFLEAQGKRYTNTRAVLSRLGMKRRAPSDPELEVYDKWTRDWGFSHGAVMAACDETLSANTPTFAYLDKILESHRNQGITGAKAMQEDYAARQEENNNIRALRREMGLSTEAIGEGERSLYRDLTRNGYELAMIAVQQVKAHSRNPKMDKVLELITSWESKGLVTPETVKKYLESIASVDEIIRKIRAKLRKGSIFCNEANRASVWKWMGDWNMPQEVIEAAAEFGAETERPMEYMEKLLAEWNRKGIHTPEAVQQDHEAFIRQRKEKTGAAAGFKRVNAQRYEQRTDDLLDDERLSAEEAEDYIRYGIQ